MAETVPTAAQVQDQFMEWMLRGNTRPGTLINELDLARKFGVATSEHPASSSTASSGSG